VKTIADRITRAQARAEQAAADYANLPDGPDKDRAAHAWSRAVDDLKQLKADAVPAA
jgi:hypothetical protein